MRYKKGELVWVNYDGLHWAALVQSGEQAGGGVCRYTVVFLVEDSECVVVEKKLAAFNAGFLTLYPPPKRKKVDMVREQNVSAGLGEFLHFRAPDRLVAGDHEALYKYFLEAHHYANGRELDGDKRLVMLIEPEHLLQGREVMALNNIDGEPLPPAREPKLYAKAA